MRPSLEVQTGLLLRRLDDARRRLQGWPRGVRGSGVGRVAGCDIDSTASTPSGAVLTVTGFTPEVQGGKLESNEETHKERKCARIKGDVA